jgi:hypothetical protein
MCLSHLIYTVRPYLIHTCHAAPMPCSDHAVLLKATAQDGRPETACGRPARVRLLPATTRSSAKVVIRSIPISDAGGQCETKQRLSWARKRVLAAHYKKKLSVKLLDQKFGYFRLPCGLSQRTRHCRSRAGARHGMCELTKGMAGERHGNGMGAAWARHAMCESALSWPWSQSGRFAAQKNFAEFLGRPIRSAVPALTALSRSLRSPFHTPLLMEHS